MAVVAPRNPNGVPQVAVPRSCDPHRRSLHKWGKERDAFGNVGLSNVYIGMQLKGRGGGMRGVVHESPSHGLAHPITPLTRPWPAQALYEGGPAQRTGAHATAPAMHMPLQSGSFVHIRGFCGPGLRDGGSDGRGNPVP